MATVTIPSRFNGPASSGQGGYSAAVLAAHLEGPAAVSLRRPVPLDEPLEVRLESDAREGRDAPAHSHFDDAGRAGTGTVARAFDAGGELVAEAVTAPPLAPWKPPPVSLETAYRAKSAFTVPPGGIFDRCFVCGGERGDGFHVAAGPVSGTDLVASPLTLPDWAGDEDGTVLPEFVWAALDCPGYFSLHGADQTIAFLARQQSEVLAPVRVGVEYVVVGRPLGRSRRKGFAATAILDPAGEVLAQSEQLLVVPREEMSHG